MDTIRYSSTRNFRSAFARPDSQMPMKIPPPLFRSQNGNRSRRRKNKTLVLHKSCIYVHVSTSFRHFVTLNLWRLAPVPLSPSLSLSLSSVILNTSQIHTFIPSFHIYGFYDIRQQKRMTSSSALPFTTLTLSQLNRRPKQNKSFSFLFSRYELCFVVVQGNSHVFSQLSK